MKKVLILALSLGFVFGAQAQTMSGGGGGGAINGGTTPIIGTCTSGNFLYNNSGVVGCSSSSATIALPQALTGGVQGGIPWFSATTTMSASALLANGALMIGGGVGAAPSTITTGTGVTTALGVTTGSAGAFVVNGGALGTPSGGTLTNATGLPIAGVTGWGTGVATAVGTAVNTNGGPVTASTASIASGALLTGGGSGTAISAITPGTGVATALAANVTGSGSIVLQGTPTINTPTLAVAGTPAWSLDANSTLYPRVTLATNMTTGFLNIPGAAGVPSGVPANTTGIPLYWNTSTNSLYGYNAGWQAISGGGGTPGGSNTQVQFNNSSAFGGSANFTWDNTNAALSVGGGTVTTSNPVLNLTQTWNAGAVTFTGLKLNVTNTASASSSLLLDIGTGGGSYVSKFKVDKNGIVSSTTNIINNSTIAYNPGYQILDDIGGGIGFGLFYSGGNNRQFKIVSVSETSNPGLHLYLSSGLPQISSSTQSNNSPGGINFSNGIVIGNSSVGTVPANTVALTGNTATLQLGAADAAAPVAQTFQVQSVVAGTTNTAGTNWTLNGSKSTGAVVGGDIIIQTSAANAAATTQNAPVEIIRFKGSAAASANPGRILNSGQIESSGSVPTAAGSGGICATGAIAGGANAGTITLTGTCVPTNTVTLTFKTASATGWSCFAMNRNVPANLMQETSTSTTTAVLTAAGATSGATDVIQYACTAY